MFPGTMVLETTWHTPSGWLVIHDLLVMDKTDVRHRRPDYHRAPTGFGATGVLLRTATCLSGQVEVMVDCAPFFEASRVEPRDYADTARMLERYSPAALISFARRLDPGLTARDFADAGRQLDQIDDGAFTRYGLTRRDIAALRDKFAAWPRTPQAATARPDETKPARTSDPGEPTRRWEPEPGR